MNRKNFNNYNKVLFHEVIDLCIINLECFEIDDTNINIYFRNFFEVSNKSYFLKSNFILNFH
mgnify:CR=1 FL=1